VGWRLAEATERDSQDVERSSGEQAISSERVTPLILRNWALKVGEIHEAIAAGRIDEALLCSGGLEAEIAKAAPPATTLYDWSDPSIPEWVEWIATDDDGTVCLFQHRPDVGPGIWNRIGGNFSKLLARRPDLMTRWDTSLERRPKP
jgi:hypothetical protein